jgi:hypothetical protein
MFHLHGFRSKIVATLVSVWIFIVFEFDEPDGFLLNDFLCPPHISTSPHPQKTP